MKIGIRTLQVLALGLALLGGSAWAEVVEKPAVQKEQLVGVWSAHKFTSEAGETTPRVEFQKNGSFRMRSQFGDEKKGTWKWKNDTVVALTYPGVGRTIELTIVMVNEKKMVHRVRRETEYIRLPSWEAKDGE